MEIMKKNSKNTVLSNLQIEKEFERTMAKRKRRRAFLSSVAALLVLTAVMVIVSAVWLPVYSVAGISMEPGLRSGQIVVGLRTQYFKPGDVVALYYENQILLRRVVGTGGDRIHIDNQGVVSVNGEAIEEEYISASAAGKSDITYPYQVPKDHYFVMGDNRAEAVDSRLAQIGCIGQDKIAAKIILILWPLRDVAYIG